MHKSLLLAALLWVIPLAACSWDTRSADAVQVGAAHWTHPNQDYTLSFAGTDWVTADPRPYGEEALVAASPRDMDGGLRVCLAKSRPFPAPPWTGQADLNRAAERFDFASLAEIATEQTVSHRVVDGVTIAESVFNATDFRMHYALFVVRNGTRISYHEVSCSGALPMSAEDIEAADAILGTITFNQQRNGI